jgi:hypothetical protein
MTVQELIDILKRLPPDMEVRRTMSYNAISSSIDDIDVLPLDIGAIENEDVLALYINSDGMGGIDSIDKYLKDKP